VPRRILITGRAGSGKTRKVLSHLAAQIQQRREGECLLLLPTQGQVDHVKGLLLREGSPAFRDDFAHTFFTLARSLGRDLPDELLSEAGRDYLIGDVLRLEPLPAFQAVRVYPGFRRLMGRVLKELKENRITSENYAERILAPLGGEDGTGARHRELGKAFAAYARLLRERRRCDQEDLASRALARLESDPGLLGDRTLLLVDGFHDFTPVQFRILDLLAERIPETVFTLSFDADRPEHLPFKVSAATRRALLDRGFREEVLRGNRRTDDATLLRLEEKLFTEAAAPAEAGDSLRILRATGKEEEVERIARFITRLVREEQVPYRDVAILYHDVGGVAELLEGTLRRFGIPVRIRQPRPMGRQPLTRFLLDLGGILARGPERKTLLRFLKSGYVVGLDLAEVDRLDERLRETGPPASPAGWRTLCAKLRLSGVERVFGVLSERASRLKGEHGPEILKAGWLGMFEEIALPLGEKGSRGGEECAALEAFHRVVDEAGMRGIRGKGKMPLALLLQNVEEGVLQATFRVRDRRREVVNVIDAYEARQWEVPHLFVAGILERQFPPSPVEDLFFNDVDRRRLEATGLRFPDRERRQSEERFLFYTAVTRARSRLHLSYPVIDSRGNPTLPSFFLREVHRLFTEESIRKQTAERPPSAVLAPPAEMVSLEDVDRAILLGMEERFPRGEMPRAVALAAALYQRRVEKPAFRGRLAALLEERRPVLSDQLVLVELAAADVAFSNSSLVAFLQCPYFHFAGKWLRLHPLPHRDITPVELGNVIHATLKEYFEAGKSGDPVAILDRQLGTLLASKRPAFSQKAEYWRLRAALKALLEAEKERGGSLVPAVFEVSFGSRTAGGLPRVPLWVEGREERLSGRIDRIDKSRDGRVGVVVDYKYSPPDSVRKQLSKSLGEDLEDFQIALYLLALQEVLGMEPAGAELVSLKRQVRRFGIGRRRFRDSGVLPAEEGKDWKFLEEDEYAAMLARARERIAILVKGIRSGKIETSPHDLKRCGPTACDAADICRFDRWVAGQKKGE